MLHLPFAVTAPTASINSQWSSTLSERQGQQVDVWTFTPQHGAGLEGAAVDELFRLLFPAIGNRAKKLRRQALQSALVALAQAFAFGQTGQPLSFLYSRSTSRWKPLARYRERDYDSSIYSQVLMALEGVGLVRYVNGFKDKDAPQGVTTLWTPEPAMQAWLEEHGADLEVVRFREQTESIRLKGDDKKLTDYEDNEATRGMRQRVDAGNALRAGHEWSYTPLESDSRVYAETERPIPAALLYSYRVFQGDFKSGGRFYCGAQGLRKAERSTITINGRPTIELDYKSLHPRLLYNSERLTAPDDCYASDKRPRELTKLASLLSINCRSFRQAVQAFTNETGFLTEEATTHLKEYAEEHQAIKHRFFESGWKSLQYLDSRLVDTVLDVATAAGIPVLPIHDSFIVNTEHGFWLLVKINEAYKQLTGYDAVIDWEPQPEIEGLYGDADG